MNFFDFKKFFLILMVLGLTLPASPGLAQTCDDDPRLAELSAILKSGSPPERPLTMRPETFLRLHPSVRAALGRAVTICPGTPLNAEGRPLMRPVKVAFPDLWEKIEICVGRGDWAEVAYLRDNFAPLPLPPEAVFSLLVMPTYSEKNMKQLAQTLRITPFSDRGQTRFFVADAFSALGGKTEGSARLGLVASLAELDQVRTKAKALGRSEIFIAYGGPWQDQVVRSLKNCGVNADLAQRILE